MRDVHVGPVGVGLAVGTEPVACEPGERRSYARFLRTIDGGVTWQAIEPDIGRWGRLRAGASWPPEAVDSIAVLAGGMMAFAWEDPWLFEGPHCHLVLSVDVSWHRDEEPPRPREEMPPPLIGLAGTGDGGRSWQVISSWEGPRNIDLNRRHQLALEVH